MEISSVEIAPAGGHIGMMPCPGGGLALYTDTNYDGVSTDLRAIYHWGAAALVSLVEAEEMIRFGVADLPEKAIQHNLAFYHLPIRDMSIPDEEFERHWQDAGERLRSLLLSGESIVLHCLAGLGRTGTIAARLLVELGDEPETAIRRIRAARPGAIQTIMQEEYVRQCRNIVIGDKL